LKDFWIPSGLFNGFKEENCMRTVEELLARKGRDVWHVKPGTSIYDALKLMNEKNVGAVLVGDAGFLAGIFSERDYARKVVLEGKSSRETPVDEAMTPRVTCVHPDQPIEECMALMTDKRVRHLPVIEQDQVVGVISIGDVVQAIISKQEYIIEQLEHYITAR
jgi:CBS domain-containing protein